MSGKQSQFNILDEITKVAAIKATSGLSKLLESPLGVDVIPVETKNLDEIKFIMDADTKIVGLSLAIVGLLPGTCLLICPEKSAFSICDILFHRKEGETKSFSEMETSALTEVANIVTGNFLTVFAMSLQIDSLMHRAAHFNYSEFADFMEEISLTLNNNIKGGNIVEMAFRFQNSKIQGLVIFLFDEKKVLDLIQKVNA